MTLIYETSFENITVVDPQHLSIPLSHRFNFEGEGSRIWIENARAYEGTKCLGMEHNWPARRLEFNLSPWNKPEYYFKGYFLFPSDYQVLGWNEIATIFQEYGPTYRPYVSIYLPRLNEIQIGGRDNDGNRYNFLERAITVPRDTFFPIAWYLLRHPINGNIKVWFNGQLICDQWQSTMNRQEYFCSLAKIYYGTDEAGGNRVFLDNIELHDQEPGTSPPVPVPEPTPEPEPAPEPEPTPEPIPEEPIPEPTPEPVPPVEEPEPTPEPTPKPKPRRRVWW